MYICPKCGKHMTWYMTYCYGGWPMSGWKCACGYDTNHWANTVTTNRTITKTIRYEEREASDESLV